jgi:hypothetical protein
VDGLSANHDHASPGTMTQANKKPKKPISIKPVIVSGTAWECVVDPSALNFLTVPKVNQDT